MNRQTTARVSATVALVAAVGAGVLLLKTPQATSAPENAASTTANGIVLPTCGASYDRHVGQLAVDAATVALGRAGLERVVVSVGIDADCHLAVVLDEATAGAAEVALAKQTLGEGAGSVTLENGAGRVAYSLIK